MHQVILMKNYACNFFCKNINGMHIKKNHKISYDSSQCSLIISFHNTDVCFNPYQKPLKKQTFPPSFVKIWRLQNVPKCHNYVSFFIMHLKQYFQEIQEFKNKLSTTISHALLYCNIVDMNCLNSRSTSLSCLVD